MDKRFRGSSAEKIVQKTQNIKIDSKELKKIKVEIKRKIPTSNETKELDHSLERPEEIKIYRCQGEGSRPIFDRTDVIVNKEETERRTVSAYSPHRSPNRQNSSRKSSDNYTSFSNSSPRRAPESPKRKTSRRSRSPKRENVNSNKSNRHTSSPYRDASKPGSSRDFHSSSRNPSRNPSRNRSRSREDNRRAKRSRSRSPRREFARRRNTRSPDDRDRRRYERRYGQSERDRRHGRSRSPRYARSPPRRRSRDRPPHNPHLTPIDPATVLILPPFYGPEDAVWFPPPIRPPIFVPPGVQMPPRGMYRGPMMPGMRPPLPGRPPYGPRHPPFIRQVRPQNRPQLQ